MALEHSRLPDEETLDAFGKVLFNNKTPSWPVAASVHAVLQNKDAHYTRHEIPKGDGRKRIIEAPSDTLKFIQGQMNDLLMRAKLPDGVYGFRKGMSVYTGLRAMLDKLEAQDDGEGNLGAVYETDITDFFPSVTQEQAKEMIHRFLWRVLHRWEKGPQLPEEMIRNLTDLMADLCCLHGRLPQGAPTSPAVANMVGATFDGAIQHVFQEEGADHVYGRYADDIVVMGTDSIPEKHRGLVQSILKSCGFKTSPRKTDYREGKDRYDIWGVEVIPADADKEVGLRFKLPARLDREWAQEMFAFMEGDQTGVPTDATFKDHQQVLQILGRLSHAYAVTKHGSDKRREMDVNGARQLYCLPPKLAHAWVHFQKKYGNRLPKSHPSWFSDFALKYTKEVEYEKVGKKNFGEIMTQRLDGLAEKRGLVAADFRAEIDAAKKELLKQFPERDAQGLQCSKDGNDYADAVVADALKAFAKGYDQIPPAELDARIHAHIVRCVAFVELMHEKSKAKAKSLGGYESDSRKESLLPADIATGWERMREKLIEKKEFEKAKGLKFLFWDRQKTTGFSVDRVAKEEDGSAARKAQWVSFPGFEEK